MPNICWFKYENLLLFSILSMYLEQKLKQALLRYYLVWHFSLKNNLDDESITEIVAKLFSFDQLIVEALIQTH